MYTPVELPPQLKYRTFLQPQSIPLFSFPVHPSTPTGKCLSYFCHHNLVLPVLELNLLGFIRIFFVCVCIWLPVLIIMFLRLIHVDVHVSSFLGEDQALSHGQNIPPLVYPGPAHEHWLASVSRLS